MLWKSALCFGIAFAVPGHAPAATAPADKPNIVFIISDDHRYDCIGAAGNPHVKTPNLDRMAAEGQYYRNFTIQIPTCSASRSAILTGLPAYRNGWYSNEFQRKDVISGQGFDQYNLLPKQMISNGYHTALVGKWHITPDPWLCGFQTIERWMLGGAGPYKDPLLATGNSRAWKVEKGFTQTIFGDDAVKVLKQQAEAGTTQPLFLWAAFTAPHGPFGPNPENFEKMYAGKTAEELAPPTFYDDPNKANQGKQSWASYYASISALDEQVGRMMDTIRQSPSLADNTIVIFMGDNGFMMGRRDMQGKYVPYEDSLRVPMIAWGPSRYLGAKGTTVTEAINSLDLSPTFVKLAGGAAPKDWTGRDFSAVLHDGKGAGFAVANSASPDNMHMIKHVNAYRVIRSGDHKLIEWHPDNQLSPELYDLTADPAENVNLFGKPAAAAAQKALTDELNRYRLATGDDQWDMKGPLGMFEPERLKWKDVDRSPNAKLGSKPKPTAEGEANPPAATPGRNGGKRKGNKAGKKARARQATGAAATE